MLYRMENSERIALLLEIIADELYIARTDREGVSGSGPDSRKRLPLSRRSGCGNSSKARDACKVLRPFLRFLRHWQICRPEARGEAVARRALISPHRFERFFFPLRKPIFGCTPISPALLQGAHIGRSCSQSMFDLTVR